jgi:hypothetical protein
MISMSRRIAIALLILAIPSVFGAAKCPLERPVSPGDTLPGLADFYFGDTRYWSAILLATNSRTPQGFPFLANVNDIGKAAKVCVPDLPEAQQLRSQYEHYLRAVHETALPEPWQVVGKLVEFPPDRELHVVGWNRDDQLRTFRGPGGSFVTTAPAELWVTVEPHLRDFCTEFTRSHGANLDQLTLRLEQHLGLAPASNKVGFIRIRLAHPTADVIFRPCMSPVTSSTNCPTGPPRDAGDNHRNWVYRQYYSSYGQSQIGLFPWTALGYTFDWAPGAPGKGEFERYGESEFVIPKGAPVEITGTVSTAEYCRPN